MPSKIALIFSLSFVLCSYFLRCLQRHRSKTHFVQWKRAVHLWFLLDSNENEGAGRFPFSRTLLMQHDVSCSLLLYLHFVVKENKLDLACHRSSVVLLFFFDCSFFCTHTFQLLWCRPLFPPDSNYGRWLSPGTVIRSVKGLEYICASM